MMDIDDSEELTCEMITHQFDMLYAELCQQHDEVAELGRQVMHLADLVNSLDLMDRLNRLEQVSPNKPTPHEFFVQALEKELTEVVVPRALLEDIDHMFSIYAPHNSKELRVRILNALHP